MDGRSLRRLFFGELASGLKVVWPILSALLLGVILQGVTVAVIEGWPLFNGVYFAFVTGLTIGYGDLVPRRVASRVLAVGIGLLGVLLIALLAAIAVRAMEGVSSNRRGS